MSDARQPVIAVDTLIKRFGSVTALDGVSFGVERGELFGLIGPDGGGKTTLFRILTTLMVADSGSAKVFGLDVVKDLWAIRARVGYMPGRFSLYPDLSIEENLGFFASVFGTTVARERNQIAAIYSQLEPFKDRRAADLSGGMKQKLALCCALVHRPDLLLLDEPTTGVDAISRREFWDLLSHLKESGMTIVVSTPYMDEADRCDRIALVQRGGLLMVDTPSAVARAFDATLFGVRVQDRYRALRTLRTYTHAATVYPFGEVLHYTDRRASTHLDNPGPHDGGDIKTSATDDIARDVETFLRASGFDAASVEPIAPTVEDTFIARMAASGEAVMS
jgi:ABC-2 type transport system ATP-binding protein